MKSSQKALFLTNGDEATPFDISLKDIAIQSALIGIPIGLKQREKQEGVNSVVSIMVGPAEAPCWLFSHEHKKHVIVIPDQYNYNKQPADKQAILDKIDLHSVIHEYGHALYTDIDLDKINAILEKDNVPFDMINIFEDMRIENLVSTFYLREETINDYAEVPKNLLFRPITSSDSFFETLMKILGAQGDVEPEAFSNPYYLEIKEYRERVLIAKNTEETAHISVEFYKRYRHYLENEIKQLREPQMKGAKGKPQKGTPMGGSGDEDFDDLESMLEDDDESMGGDEDGEEEGNGLSGLENKIIKEKESKKGLNGDIKPMSEKEKNALIEACKEIKISQPAQQQETKEINLDTPIKPMKENHETNNQESNTDTLIDLKTNKVPKKDLSFIQDTEKIYKELSQLLIPKKIIKPDYDDGDINVDSILDLQAKTDIQKPLFQKEKLLGIKTASMHIVYDASGSMSGTPNNNGKKILFAINEMARNGLLDAKLTVSKESGGLSKYQTVELPINYKSIFTIEANGDGEGLATAVKNSIKEKALEKDLILFFTDGNLSRTDSRELKKLFNSNPNLRNKSIGIYLREERFYNHQLFTDIFGSNIVVDKSPLNTAVKICELAKNPAQLRSRNKQNTSKKIKP